LWRRGTWLARWASATLIIVVTVVCAALVLDWNPPAVSALWTVPMAAARRAANGALESAQRPVQIAAWAVAALVLSALMGIVALLFRSRLPAAQADPPQLDPLKAEWAALTQDQRDVLYGLWKNGGQMDHIGVDSLTYHYGEGPFNAIMSALDAKSFVAPDGQRRWAITGRGRFLAQAAYEGMQRAAERGRRR
jgi:hypothetical protein